MALDRITYLGASVSTFNIGVGWGNQASTLEAVLVEDRKNGDSFEPVDIGKKTIFTYGNKQFEGILKRWQKRGSSAGSPLYSVYLEDPRELLSGTQLILSGYNGAVDVPNLINVYGWWENQGFGSSSINSAGMPYEKVYAAIASITAGLTNYGGPVLFEGESYSVDLSNLPAVPNYRIGSNNLSIMDYVQEICDAGGRDFFFRLEGSVLRLYTVDRNAIPEIGKISEYISTVQGAVSKSIGIESRNGLSSKFIIGSNVHDMWVQNPDPNVVTNFEDDAMWPYWGKKNIGDVYVGYIRDLDPKDLNTGNQVDINKYKKAIFSDLHTINLEVNNISVQGIGDNYETDIAELRAIAESVDEWRNFLDSVSIYEYTPVAEGPGTEKDGKATIGRLPIGWTEQEFSADAVDLSVIASKKDQLPFNEKTQKYIIRTPKLSDKQLIYIPTQDAMKIMSAEWCLREDTFPYFSDLATRNRALLRSKDSWGQTNVISDGSTDVDIIEQYSHKNVRNIHYLKAHRLGIHTNMSEFAGAMTKVFGDNNNLKNLNEAEKVALTLKKAEQIQEQIDVDENVSKLGQWLSGYAREFMGRKFMVRLPFVQTNIDEETGEVTESHEVTEGGFIAEDSYEFAVANKLLPVNSFNLEHNDGRLKAYARFDKADLLDISELNPTEFVFENNSLYVVCSVEGDFAYSNYINRLDPRAVVTLPTALKYKEGVDSPSNVAIFASLLAEVSGLNGEVTDDDEAEKTNAKKKAQDATQNVGGDVLQSPAIPKPIAPDAIMIPLKNNLLVYGPFSAAGAQGQVQFEQDDTLNPWTYGNYDLMNSAGNAKANSAITIQTYDETGEIEFPGFPNHDIATVLVNGGPYITNISCSATEAGVTTRYKMQTWTPIAGRTNISEVQRMQRIINNQKSQQRELRRLSQEPIFTNVNLQRELRRLNFSKELKSNTSSHFILADKNTTVVQPYYNSTNQAITNYEDKALTSLNALYTPMAFSPNASGNMAKAEWPSSGNYFNANSVGYFPFKTGERPPIVTSHGSGVPNLSASARFNPQATDDYRMVVHKGPMYMAGWGFDMDGQPVPSKNVDGVITSLFVENAGEGYTPGTYSYLSPTLSGLTPSSSGTGAFIQVSVGDGGVVTNASIENGGQGYVLGDTLTVSDGQISQNSTPFSLTVSGIQSVKRFADNHTTDVKNWKAGALDLRWDDQNKVWGFRTNSAKVVKVTNIGDVAQNYYESGIITPHVVSGTIYNIGDQTELGQEVSLTTTNTTIPLINFRGNLLVEDRFYLANLVGDKYVIDNQAEYRDYVS